MNNVFTFLFLRKEERTLLYVMFALPNQNVSNIQTALFVIQSFNSRLIYLQTNKYSTPRVKEVVNSEQT